MQINRTTHILIASSVTCFSLAILIQIKSLNLQDCVIDLTRPLTSPVWQWVDDILFLTGLLFLVLAPILARREKLKITSVFE